MKRIALFTLLTVVVLPGQPRALILADISRSESARAKDSRAEQQRVLAALPDATWCELYTVGGQVKLQFQGVLDPARRAEVRRQIQAEQFSQPNTALGEAIQEALAAVAGSTGPSRIVLFTDGQARSIPSSPYRRRSFESILSGVGIPQGTELFVSLTAGPPPRVNTPGVHLLTTPPADWAATLSIPKPPTPAPPNLPPAHSTRWIVAAALVAGLSAACGILAWRHLRSGGKLQELTASTLEDEPALDTPELPQLKPSYTVTLGDRIASIAAGEMVVVGDSPLADWYLASTNAVVQFQQQRDAAWLENIGPSTVRVGRVPVPPHRRLKLPHQPVEIAIGPCTALCFPELCTDGEVLK